MAKSGRRYVPYIGNDKLHWGRLSESARIALAQLFLEGPSQTRESWQLAGLQELLHLELAFGVKDWFSLLPYGLEVALQAPEGAHAQIRSMVKHFR